ncbi:hypothetical protein ATANTOWER_022635 [Ataeniobius toweri]|uniref:Uncharacterized protein n=1 Tax=Ataeniobius toweri TaxID=208326 RepID=A0ABU7C0P2_9TELE|nr:hypothetical protein [Ataeniobius toweri]
MANSTISDLPPHGHTPKLTAKKSSALIIEAAKRAMEKLQGSTDWTLFPEKKRVTTSWLDTSDLPPKLNVTVSSRAWSTS